MLPKKNRADTKAIKRIFRGSSLLSSPNLTFKFFKNNGKEVKISFIVPKNIAKLAVKRNLLRRRGYIALGKNIKLFPAGVVGVFIFKKYYDDFTAIENEIKNILGKIN